MGAIAHFDIDAFFAAVEERDRPWIAGRPIVVGADPKDGRGRGVVSTANYKAREFGIGSAMPISRAWKMAERMRRRGEAETVFLRGSWNKYRTTSDTIMRIIEEHSPLVEVSSVDEAYFDLSHMGSYGTAEESARGIKRIIFSKEKLTVSIGIGPNKLIAKIASGAEKPDGLTVVSESEASDFLAPLPVGRIPGIGPKAEERLKRLDIATVEEARKLTHETLTQLFGVWGGRLYMKLRGVDDSPLVREHKAKSVGEQETFELDTRDAVVVGNTIAGMAERIVRRIRREGFTSLRTVVATVRFADFTTRTRSYTPKNSITDSKSLAFHGVRLISPFLDRRENPEEKKLRLVGLRAEKLS
jgi:DNA polymerase IV (DinB-like DNA polymerase)